MKALNREIKEYLIGQGASLVGFADLSDLPSDIRDGYSNGISIAVALNPEKVMKIGVAANLEYYEEYIATSELLNGLAESGALWLKNNGFGALGKSKRVVIQDEVTRRTKLPHKTVATKAGLGWIGKCALLVTDEYGSAIRLTSILTNAELDAGMPITESRCGNCNDCKTACPAGAVSGQSFKIGMDRDEFFNAHGCKAKVIERVKGLGRTEGTCGICIQVCPWTQKYLQKSSTKI
jgi:epoxyqueuosine reductase